MTEVSELAGSRKVAVIDFGEKCMTVKEVAQALGVSAQTVRKWLRVLFPDSVRNGVRTYLNELEVTRIKQRILGTNGHIGPITFVIGDGWHDLVQIRKTQRVAE
jgi:transposase